MDEKQLKEIEERNEELYRLYNLCSVVGATWVTNYQEVSNLMTHIDKHFPAHDIVLLLREVRMFRGALMALTVQDPAKDNTNDATP